MKNFKKMDELEMNINFESIRLSWGITLFAIFIWIIIDIFKKGILAAVISPQSIILYIQLISYFLINLILNRRMANAK